MGSLIGSAVTGGKLGGTGATATGQNTIFGGLSPFDVNVAEAAGGENIQAMQNRYQQLGLGVPSGSPASAAAGGTNLTRAGPSTPELQDIAGTALATDATIGQMENFSLGPAPGSALNNAIQLANIAAQNQAGQQAGQAAGSLAGLFGSAVGGFG